jgi:glycosyltransferase involved in cell wall biosynthesis
MKILITSGLFPPDIGGPATYVPHIAEALAKRGHYVTVVAPRDRTTTCPIADPPYRLIQFHRARALRYANFFIELGRAFATILRQARTCDVLFVNGLGLAAALVARLTGKPMVVKVVGDGAWEIAYNRGWTTLSLDEFPRARGARIGLFRAMLHMAAKRAQMVVTPSHYLAGIVASWGVSKDRIRIIFNAFDIPGQQIDVLRGEELAAFDQGFRLITVGRLVPHKRIADIITVLARMDDTRLVIVGDGPQRRSLQVLVEKLGLTDRVLMTGRVPPQTVWGLLMRYADALVLNSTYEGMPHILLEAAHFGVPIVATAVGGTSEIIEDGKTGLLIPSDSPDDLFAALCRLQVDPDLRRGLAEGARRALAQFSFENMIEKTERMLEQV